MMRLRQPIALAFGRPTKVLIQARYSTEEQRQTSTEDQIANCRRFLADNMPRDFEPDQLDIEVIREPEISGELMSRPGINEIWSGIESKRWDLIIAEESSRLYRHMTFAGQLFNTAVDAGIRILCPTDYIDTADEDWPERLTSSQSQHSRANYYNRSRIKRAHQGLWERGAALGALKVGYRRRPSKPATASAPAEGPYYDEIDEETAAVVREIFARVAGDEPPWAIAEWLTSIGFSTTARSCSAQRLIALNYSNDDVSRGRQMSMPNYRPCMANNPTGTKLGAASIARIISLELVPL
ncbi:MAG: recombinase family protein [Planctomycetia bacterium]|nr:recombinase family protein [Planctomycetia bacterium]